MSSEELKPGDIHRAEQLVARIRGVSACRILVDDDGKVAEIHVVADGVKLPKLVARDVESCLKATMGVEVDYRKIGVVTVDDPAGESARPGPAPAADGEGIPADAPADAVEEFPIEEHASRFAFASVNVFSARNELRAEVELSLDGVVAFGTDTTSNTAGEPWVPIAGATLRAVSELLDEGTRPCLGGVQQLELGDRKAFVVRVDLIEPRGTRLLAGCSFVTGNLNQSVVFATLDAVNRVVGRLDFRSSVEYRIR